jgi:hypothetical protein
VARSPGEASEAAYGGVEQGGCGGDSPVWPVANEGVELKMVGGIPQ